MRVLLIACPYFANGLVIFARNPIESLGARTGSMNGSSSWIAAAGYDVVDVTGAGDVFGHGLAAEAVDFFEEGPTVPHIQRLRGHGAPRVDGLGSLAAQGVVGPVDVGGGCIGRGGVFLEAEVVVGLGADGEADGVGVHFAELRHGHGLEQLDHGAAGGRLSLDAVGGALVYLPSAVSGY